MSGNALNQAADKPSGWLVTEADHRRLLQEERAILERRLAARDAGKFVHDEEIAIIRRVIARREEKLGMSVAVERPVVQGATQRGIPPLEQRLELTQDRG